jgi:glycosyltransferase involved in cell wall biosynthesis
MKEVVGVSVLTTNYNNGIFLKDFFESFLYSSFSPEEIIIVDDGSTDHSISIINTYISLLPIKLIQLPINEGRAAALNIGKKSCTKHYTLLIDSDDMIFPDRIEKQYKFMEANPDIDILGANVLYFNSAKNSFLNRSNFPITHEKIIRNFYNGENGVLQPTVMIKTSILKSIEYIPITPGQDYVFFSVLAKKGYKFSAIKDPVNKMRIHQKSIVSNITFFSIKTIFLKRDELFNTKTNHIRIFFYYKYIKAYRKSHLSKYFLLRIFYLSLSILYNPKKLFKRMVI